MPTEEDIRRFAEYQRDVTVLETKWDALSARNKRTGNGGHRRF
jgi:hypothetical protein